jgi:hypothetical protein
MPEKAEPLAVDLLYGAPAIAAFTGLSIRQIYHQQANLGLGKLGSILVGSKSKLRERLTAPALKKLICSR